MASNARRQTISEIFGPVAPTSRKPLSGDLFSSTIAGAARLHQTFWMNNEVQQFPFVAIPADFEVGEFFATVATYYPSQSPSTAFVHVLGKETEACFDPARPFVVPNCLSGQEMHQRARLGAGLGETALAGLSSVEGALVPSYSACKRSLGFALARTVALYPLFSADVVVARWSRLRQLTGLVVSPSTMRAVCAVHSAAAKASSSSDTAFTLSLWSALVGCLSESNASDSLKNAILGCYPGLESVVEEIEGPYDGRMTAYLKVVEAIQQASHSAEVDDLAVGYFCNRILPGSFSHVKILKRLVDFFPSALVWYGAFCSTSQDFDAHQFGSGLFAKLGRDLSLPFSFAQRPQCDVSLDELEVLMRAPLRAEVIKPTQQKIAAVALLPGLDVFSRFAPDDDKVDVREVLSKKSSLIDERVVRATHLLDQAASLLHDLDKMQTAISPTVSHSKRQKRK